MTSKPYIERTENETTTIMGIPKLSVETIRTIGMMQLALIVSVGLVRDIPYPILLALMAFFILMFPWFGDRGIVEVIRK